MRNLIKRFTKNTRLYYILKNLSENILPAGRRSYSQIGEDLLLDFFLGHKKKGFYVDVGAYHPTSLSNTFFFYKKGWRGINIEPNFSRFKLFQKKRKKDINLNIGISSAEGKMDFYLFDAETLSTFSKETADKYQKLGYKLIDFKQVPVYPLVKIFDGYVKNLSIDFMSVDTEGYDMEVLKSNDWGKYRPSLIIIETAEFNNDGFVQKLNHIFDPFFSRIGYIKVADNFLNTIYMEQKVADNFFRLNFRLKL